MYQCFVRNDYDAVQGTAEMKLGGKLILLKGKHFFVVRGFSRCC